MATGFQEVMESIPFSTNGDNEQIGPSFLMMTWMASTAAGIPSYWSRSREVWLREFVTQSGPIKTALTTFINKTVTIPFRIDASDPSIDRYVNQAQQIDEALRRNSGSMSSRPFVGFKTALKMFLRDYLTQDSGAYMVILGRGPSDGPIIGSPSGIVHLDSRRCTPTSDAEFPVRYLHTDNLEYKLHFTRVIQMTNLPSPDAELLGVGLCPVSCCIEAAQELWNIYTHSEEKFGSRPPKQILFAKTGATVKNIEDAIAHWNQKLDNESRTRFGGTLVMAPRMPQQDLDFGVIDLTKAPDGFDRRDVTIADKGEIAAAFGLDLRDLAVASNVGQTRADAEVQERKGRGKGIGEFVETLKEQFKLKYLSEVLDIEWDYIDDEQDEQQANIWNVRSQARERDLRAGVTTIRVERERMWSTGEISQQQFEDMELFDGRLPNGLDVLLLFQSSDADFQAWLDVGVSDPTNPEENEPEPILESIHAKIIEVSEEINTLTNAVRARKARQALAALEKLRALYETKIAETEMEEAAALDQQATLEASPEGDVGEDDGEDESLGGDQPAEPPPETKQRNEVDVALEAFDREFYDLATMAMDDLIDQNRFVEEMTTLVVLTLMALFLRGSNLQHSELTASEFGTVQLAINEQVGFLEGLAADIYGGRYEEIGDLVDRMSLWRNTAEGIYATGQLARRDNTYFAWRVGPTEHCADCARLNGQIHTASEWRASGWRPQSHRLECEGFRCQCFLQETSGPSVGYF